MTAETSAAATPNPGGSTRRATLKALAGLGIGTATFHRAPAAQADQAGTVTTEMIRQAEWIAGLELTDEERETTARSMQRSLNSFKALRGVEVGYDVPPAPRVRPGGGTPSFRRGPPQPGQPDRNQCS